MFKSQVMDYGYSGYVGFQAGKAIGRKKNIGLYFFQCPGHAEFEPDIEQERMPGRRRKYDWRNVGPKKEFLVERAVEEEIKFNFRMRLHHSHERFEGKLANSLKPVIE